MSTTGQPCVRFASTSTPVVRVPFKCALCGSEFFDRHSCPVMPWGNTSLPAGWRR